MSNKFDPNDRPQANWRFVSPDYWKTMGVPLKQGRFFEQSDRNRRVAILSEKAARLVWPGQNPIGKHLRGTGADRSALEVVGVVADIRESALGKEPPPMAYEP